MTEELFQHLFIHSFIPKIFILPSVPGTVLGILDITLNKILLQFLRYLKSSRFTNSKTILIQINEHYFSLQTLRSRAHVLLIFYFTPYSYPTVTLSFKFTTISISS